MRSRRDPGRRMYPILSDKPAEISNPLRKVKLVTAAWVAALVMCSFAGAYGAATIAINQNDDAKRQLQADIEQSAKQRDVENAELHRILDQYRADQCYITAVLPQTADIVEIRRRYRCTNPVTPPVPAPSPAVAPSQRVSGTSLTALPRRPGSDPARPPAAGLNPNQPAPGPVPTPQPPAPALPIPVPPVVPPLPSPPPRVCLPVVDVCIARDPGAVN